MFAVGVDALLPGIGTYITACAECGWGATDALTPSTLTEARSLLVKIMVMRSGMFALRAPLLGGGFRVRTVEFRALLTANIPIVGVASLPLLLRGGGGAAVFRAPWLLFATFVVIPLVTDEDCPAGRLPAPCGRFVEPAVVLPLGRL